MSGWRRIGIVLSVIWFSGFGVFLLVEQPFSPATRYAHGYCSNTALLRMKNLNWNECLHDTIQDWESNHPRSLWNVVTEVLVANLLTIGLGWLVVWGCVAVVRWIRRGFAHDVAR
jgi:hypothetical protein